MECTGPRRLELSTEAETRALATDLAELIAPGDTILLSGPIGAGKSFLTRSIIQACGVVEDIPSPTFTLVQTYETSRGEIWHADLYRLTNVDDVLELGLDAAFDDAICLIEWPDRLGALAPPDALRIELEMTETPGARLATLSAGRSPWSERLPTLLAQAGSPHDR